MSNDGRISVLWLQLGVIEEYTEKTLLARCGKQQMQILSPATKAKPRFFCDKEGYVGYILFKNDNHPLEEVDVEYLAKLRAFKPFLRDGKDRFICASNFDEISRFLKKNRGYVANEFNYKTEIKSKSGELFENVAYRPDVWPWEWGENIPNFQDYDSVYSQHALYKRNQKLNETINVGTLPRSFDSYLQCGRSPCLAGS